MKLLLTILIIFSIFNASAASSPVTYFVSAIGNNTDGKSLTNAWTLAKLNANWSLINPGDTVKLNSGETFFGTITPTKSGTASSPIIITSTGTTKPIVTGLTSASFPSFTGPGIYTSTTVFSPESEPTFAIRNNLPMELGRWPNVSDAGSDGGYLKITSVPSGNTQALSKFNDASYATYAASKGITGNWIGASVVVRTDRYDALTATVSGQSVASGVTTFSYSTTKTRYPQTNFGYYFARSLKTLDQDGEFFYDPSTKKISVYTTSALTNVKVPVLDNAFSATDISYLTVINIEFQGGNAETVNVTGGTNITFDKCKMYFGGNSVYFNTHAKATVSNCDVNYSTGQGIDLVRCKYATVIRNTVANSAVSLTTRIGEGSGIYMDKSNGLVQYNNVQNSGKIGIEFGDPVSDLTIKNNYVANFCMQITDAGAIYTGAYKDDTCRNRFIVGNIIEKPNLTSWHGTPETSNSLYASGIYIDNHANGVTIDGNTIIGVPVAVQLHYPTNIITINNNIFGGNSRSIRSQNTDKSVAPNVSYSKGNVWKNNNILMTGTGGNPVFIEELPTSTFDENVIGTFDNNKYFRPLAQSTMKLTKYTNTSSSYLFADWKTTFSPWDANSTDKPPMTYAATDTGRFKVVYNASELSKTFSLDNKTWVNMSSGSYTSNTLTLAPYESEMLMHTPSVAVVVPNTPPAVSITSPVNNAAYNSPATIPINVTATDADGVSKVEFYNGNTLLGTDITSPYSYSWNNVGAGVYSITAIATDTKNATGSATIQVSVKSSNIPPVISIDTPVNNGKYIAPATVRISMTATDPDGTVDSVLVYSNGQLIHKDLNKPFSWDWVNVPVGSYTLTAVAYDNNKATTTSNPVNINVRILTAPDVSLTSPLSGSFTAPATINIAATATDADGNIVKVEFYNNGVLVNTDATYPYSYTLTNAAKGSYLLTAKAYDNDGQVTTSSTVTVVVSNKQSPLINISSPLTGAVYNDPAEVSITASASDPDGVIKRVDFYRDTILIGSDITAPFSIVWSSAMAGHYSLTAKAVDNDTLSTTSAAVGITINHTNIAPRIDIIEPGDITLVGEQTRFTAIANDVDGKVVKVEFYNGSTLIGTVTNAPYSIDLSLAAGTYTLVAKATDNSGATTQKTVTKTVREPILTDPIIIKGHKAILQ